MTTPACVLCVCVFAAAASCESAIAVSEGVTEVVESARAAWDVAGKINLRDRDGLYERKVLKDAVPPARHAGNLRIMDEVTGKFVLRRFELAGFDLTWKRDGKGVSATKSITLGKDIPPPPLLIFRPSLSSH